jgi:S1-C subfamily serine protease
MSDETPDNVPVPEPPTDDPAGTGPADEPTEERAGLEPEYRSPEYPPPANSGWASPPAWGSAQWGQSGWGQTPAPPSPPYGPSDAPGGAGGGGWNYGYGGLWTPPPEPPPARGPDSTRRALAAIAVVILVLVSGALGAVISAAVHDKSSPPVASPFIGGSRNNPFGSNSGTPNTGSDESSAVASKVSPSLVNIYTTIETSSGRGQAAGTGMIISSSGEVLTNNHVIADASTVRVELVATGKAHAAKVLGYDVKDDIALLQIDNVSNLKAVSLADATKVAVGDSIVAIGNAGGRGGSPTVTSGSVTALDQKVTAGDQGTGASETLVGMIEISAPIEPGDSGGALVNSRGQVIGMNTAAAVGDSFSGQSGSTTAFAIPINRAIRLAQQIGNGEESANVHVGERGLLGVQVQDISAQTQVECPGTTNSGALVAGTESGSPADSAGLGQCDVIVSVAGKNVATTSDLNEAMFPFHPDEKVTVGWVDPSGSSHQADLTLTSGPPA